MKISKEKKQRISEQILAYLFENYPVSSFTSQVAQEIARDEEFVKSLLVDLKKKKLVKEIKKNPEGVDYVRRSRWTLSDEAYAQYKKYQG